jgi:hypothetical protein
MLGTFPLQPVEKDPNVVGSSPATRVTLSRALTTSPGGGVGRGVAVAAMASGVGVDTNPRVGVGPVVAPGGGANVAAGPPQATMRTVSRASRPGIPAPLPVLNFGIIDIGISCIKLRIGPEKFPYFVSIDALANTPTYIWLLM